MNQPLIHNGLGRMPRWMYSLLLMLIWLLVFAGGCDRSPEKQDNDAPDGATTAAADTSLRHPGDTIQFVLMGQVQEGAGLVAKLYQVGAPGGRKVVAQTQLDNEGHFKIVHKHATPRVYKLEFDAGHKYLYLDRDTIRLKGHIQEVSKMEVLNSDLTAQLYEYWQSKHRAENPVRLYRRKMRSARNPEDKQAYRDSMKMFEANKQERLDAYYRGYIASTDTSPVSAKAALAMNPYDNYDYLKSLAAYYDRRYPYLYDARQLSDQLYFYRDIVPGSQAPEIQAQDTAGRPVQLSDYRGRFVLLTFWLSACQKCRDQFSELQALQKDLPPSANLSILSYSFNIQKDYWTTAIREEQADWDHFSHLKGYDVSVTEAYMIENMPMYYFLDPEGRVINRYRFASRAAAEVRALLGQP